MKTTLTIVDNFHGTVVIESDGDTVEFKRAGDGSFSLSIDGIEQGPTTTGPSEPPIIIRTPGPEEQTLKTTFVDTEAQHTATEKPQDAPKDEKASPTQPSTPELKLGRPAARKLATKKCQYCGDEYQGANRSMYCDKRKDPASRPRRQLPAAAEPAKSDHPDANTPLPEGHWWCIHHQAQVTHKSPDCPLLEKPDISPAKRAEEASKAAGEGDEFTDPWNCGRCRDEKHLCKFHRSMEAGGSKPPANVRQL